MEQGELQIVSCPVIIMIHSCSLSPLVLPIASEPIVAPTPPVINDGSLGIIIGIVVVVLVLIVAITITIIVIVCLVKR